MVTREVSGLVSGVSFRFLFIGLDSSFGGGKGSARGVLLNEYRKWNVGTNVDSKFDRRREW